MAVTRVGGVVGDWIGRGVGQLNSETPYSESLLVQDVVLDPDARRACDDYCGDLSGRYLEMAARCRTLGFPVDWKKAQRVARRVLAAQRPDGTFGPNRPGAATDHGVAWGNGRLLTGLIAFADVAEGPLKADLESAAERLVESIVAAAPSWLDWFADEQNSRLKFAMDFLSTLDPLISWYRRSGVNDQLEAARAMAAVIPPPVGEFHMHGYLLALRGWLELAEIDGDSAAIKTITAYRDRIRAGWLLPHGGVLESVKLPRDINTEGCGIADWLMLTLRLNQLREDAGLLDQAERTLYNALAHTQRPSGHFGCETLTADPGLLTFDYPPEAWWCCTCHGLRALHDAAQAAVREDGAGVRVDLLIDSAGELPGGTGYELRTGYPRDGAVTLRLSGHGATAVRIRIPGTSLLGDLRVDGEPVKPLLRRGFAHIALDLDGTADITLELERAVWIASGEVRFLTPTANCTDVTGPLHERRGAIFHGPLLLAADAARNDLEDVLRSRRAEIRADGDRFSLAAGARTTGHGFAQRFGLVLAPLADQIEYDRDVTSRIEFDEIIAVPPPHPS